MLAMDAQELPDEDTNSCKGFDGSACSEEEMMHKEILIWMRNMRTRLSMQTELLACRDEQRWLCDANIAQSIIARESTGHERQCQSL